MSSDFVKRCLVAAVCIEALEAEVNKLKWSMEKYEDRAEVAEARAAEWEKNHEALQEKIRGIKSCACDYDEAGTVCLHHSPALQKAETRAERLRWALRVIANEVTAGYLLGDKDIARKALEDDKQ